MKLEVEVYRYLFVWLSAGMLLGVLYLARHIPVIMLRIKKFGEAIIDLIFCVIACIVTYLVALATDYGRLHIWQIAVQTIGAVLVILSLEQFIIGCATKISSTWLRMLNYCKRHRKQRQHKRLAKQKLRKKRKLDKTRKKNNSSNLQKTA